MYMCMHVVYGQAELMGQRRTEGAAGEGAQGMGMQYIGVQDEKAG